MYNRSSIRSEKKKKSYLFVFPKLGHMFPALHNVTLSLQIPVQIQLLSCVESLMEVCDQDFTDSPQSSQSVFNLLHTILALQQGEIILEKVRMLLRVVIRKGTFCS